MARRKTASKALADDAPTISTRIPYATPREGTMESLPSISDAIALIRTYERDHVSELPPKAAAGLSAAVIMISSVDIIVRGGEAMYAAHKQALLPQDGMVVCGQEISYATDNGWHGLAGGRGQGIVAALRRDIGEAPTGPAWPLPEDDPLPLEEYLEPTAPPPISPPPPPVA